MSMSAHEDTNEIAAFLDDLRDRLADVDVDKLTEQEIRPWLDEIDGARIRIDAFKKKYRGDRWQSFGPHRWTPILAKQAALYSRLDQLGRTTDQEQRGQESKMSTVTIVLLGLTTFAALVVAALAYKNYFEAL